jgi:hypothetical protein
LIVFRRALGLNLCLKSPSNPPLFASGVPVALVPTSRRTWDVCEFRLDTRRIWYHRFGTRGAFSNTGLRPPKYLSGRPRGRRTSPAAGRLKSRSARCEASRLICRCAVSPSARLARIRRNHQRRPSLGACRRSSALPAGRTWSSRHRLLCTRTGLFRLCFLKSRVWRTTRAAPSLA